MEKFLIKNQINEEILEGNIFFKNLIFEDLYINDIFNDLIEDIVYSYQNLITEYFKLNTEQIKKLLPNIFLGKRYFKKDKCVYVIITNFLTYNFLSFSYNEFDKERIKNNLLTSNNFFIADLDCFKNNEGILFLDEKIFKYNIMQFRKSLIHELIHVFQWITGRSIYDVLKEKTIEISQQEQTEINECFKTRKNFDLNIIFNALLDKYEIADYCQQVYNELKQYLLLSDLYIFFKNLCKVNLSFKQRFKLMNKYIWFKNLKINYQLFLLLSSHYKIGINTIKNHIFGYYYKQKININRSKEN